MQKVASLKFHFHRRRRRRGRHRTRTSSVIFASLCFLLVHLASASNSMNQEPEIKLSHHYAQLARAGPLRGIQLTWRDESRSPTGSHSLSTLAYLGLAYAAPPVGLLRLMPPGAPIYTKHTSGDSMSTARLMPANREAQVRNQNQFGRQCVRLSDWRSTKSLATPLPGDKTNDHVTTRVKIGPDSIASAEAAQRNRHQQSEDCLNLNLFFPIASNLSSQGEAIEKKAHKNFNNDESIDLDANGRQLWPISRLMGTRRLPVVVLFLGEHDNLDSQETGNGNNNNSNDNKEVANSYAHLKLAHRLNAIVITFNHRIGLLATTRPASASAPFPPKPPPFWPATGQVRGGEEGGENKHIEYNTNRQSSWRLRFDDWPDVQQSTTTNPTAFIITHLSSKLSSGHLNETNSKKRTTNTKIGFLPSIDTSSNLVSQTSATLSSHNPNAARNNHALWDQIALLHWVRHNVMAFNGDANNVTLMALDNQAARYVQLLSLSPLAKGLFSHVMLLTQQVQLNSMKIRDGDKQVSLSQLLKFASETKDSRRKLVADLSMIIQKQLIESSKLTNDTTTEQLANEQKVAQFLQVANLTQLAQIEYELELVNSDAQLALIKSPTLDDKLLFPHFSLLIKQQSFNLVAAFINTTYKKAQLNYCLYVNRLYNLKSSDDLKLISSDPTATTKLNFDGPSKSQRSNITARNLDAASQIFHTINNINKLEEILDSPLRELEIPLPANPDENLYENEEEDDEEDEEKILKKQHDRTILIQSGILGPGSNKRRLVGRQRDLIKRNTLISGHFGERSGSDLEELMSIVSSFDLMIGVSKLKDSFDRSEHLNFRPRNPLTLQNYSHLIEAAMNVTSIPSMGHQEDLLDVVNFADLHALASWFANEQLNLNQLCGFKFTSSIITPSKSTLMFETISDTTKKNVLNSLVLSDHQIVTEMNNFIRTKPSNDRWPQYDTLSRRCMLYDNQNSSWLPSGFVEPQVELLLDVIPYMREINHEINQGKSHLARDNLLNCLAELDATFSNMMLSPDTHELLLDRIQKETKCLKVSIAKFRGQLKQVAWDDLEPLISKVQLINKQRQQQEKQQQPQRQSQFDLQDQPPLRSGNEAPQTSMDESTSSHNTSMVLVARDNSQRVTAQRDGSRTSSMLSRLFGGQNGGENSPGIRGFLAKAYKDAIGQALTIVVGTGLFIFILNLLIVVIITLRSRARSNRGVGDSSATGGQESELVNGEILGQTMQPTAVIKSTLKKTSGVRQSNNANMSPNPLPNGHPSAYQNINDFNGSSDPQTNESDLTPRISISKSVNFDLDGTSSTALPQKRLQFDLTGVQNGPNSRQAEQDDMYDEFDRAKQQVVLLDVVNLNANVSSDGNESNQLIFETNQPTTMFLPEGVSNKSNDQQHEQNNHEHQYQNWSSNEQQIYNCSVDLSPPFNSTISPSTSSNITIGGTMFSNGNDHNHNHHHQHYNSLSQSQGYQATKQQTQRRAPINFINRHNTFHHHQHSSPGGSTMTSTSHSMTPIQLESFAITTSGATSSEMSPPGLMMTQQQQQQLQLQDNYQLEPFGLIYAPTLEELNSGSFVQFQQQCNGHRESESMVLAGDLVQNLLPESKQQQLQNYNSMDPRHRGHLHYRQA